MILTLSLTLILIAASVRLAQIKAEGKDLAFVGKGKDNEEFARKSICYKICVDKLELGQFADPWNESHQICSCWDAEEYRKNTGSFNCTKSQELLFIIEKDRFTCSQMCKKYVTDMYVESMTYVQLRQALVCETKMLYGVVAACFCDLKFAGNDPFIH